MSGPITIEVKVPAAEMRYDDDDATTFGKAVEQAIRLYWYQGGGGLHGVTIDFEEYELNEGDGTRVILMGEQD